MLWLNPAACLCHGVKSVFLLHCKTSSSVSLKYCADMLLHLVISYDAMKIDIPPEQLTCPISHVLYDV